MHTFLRFRISIALAAFGLLTAMPARAQNRPLFSDERDGPAAVRASAGASDPVIRSRQVTVDLSLLAQGGISTGGEPCMIGGRGSELR